jgi:CheY-like chemotaxis protein
MSHILIVEDEEFLIKTLGDNLTAEGYKVESAKNGEEAIEKVGKNKPDLILLDILMPKSDGFYVLEQIKNNPKWKLIPVIVLSNLGEDTTIKKALAMGADDYFVKSQHPIQEVIEKAQDYLEGRQAAKH